jgi:retron-type reverse transcriptase
VCRERCWRADWVLDMDIQKFFDSVPWDLTLRAVAHHTDRWRPGCRGNSVGVASAVCD